MRPDRGEKKGGGGVKGRWFRRGALSSARGLDAVSSARLSFVLQAPLPAIRKRDAKFQVVKYFGRPPCNLRLSHHL